MTRRERTANDVPSPEAVTDLILRIFRVNGRLLLAGDQLVEPLGLTSARWQVLGAIADANQPQPVVRLARNMGVSRQAVQRIANDLASAGLIAFKTNPNHKRAQLIEFTDHGRTLFDQAMILQRPWAMDLTVGLTKSQVKIASLSLDLMLKRLDYRQARTKESN